MHASKELAELLGAAKGGRPTAVAIQVQGTFGAGCDCPPFSAWYSKSNEDEPLWQWIIPVPDPGVPDIGTFRTNLQFITVGYFSGAIIDTYEYFRAIGMVAPTPDEEERYTWKDLYPEFCLQAWCYAIPSYGDDQSDYVKSLREVSQEHAKELAKKGVSRCNRSWFH